MRQSLQRETDRTEGHHRGGAQHSHHVATRLNPKRWPARSQSPDGAATHPPLHHVYRVVTDVVMPADSIQSRNGGEYLPRKTRAAATTTRPGRCTPPTNRSVATSGQSSAA